jgi:polar amino acid transport system substrate-binding protein
MKYNTVEVIFRGGFICMKKTIILMLAVIFIVSSLFAGCGNKADEDNSLKDVMDKGHLILGMDDNFPPMGFRDDNNELVGFDVDLAKEVTARMGIELKLQPIDWSQKTNELNAGQVDCLWNGYTITEQRKVETNITDPYMKNRQVLVVLDDSGYQTKADLAGKTLVLQAESSAVEALDSDADFKGSLKQVIELKDNVAAFLDLKSKSSDVLLIDEIVANYYIEKQDDSFRVLDEALAEEDYGVGFRVKDQALRDEVQKHLEEMAADGTLAEISEAWFGKDITTIGK